LISEALKNGEPRIFRLFDTFKGFAGVGKNDRADVKNGRMFVAEPEKMVDDVAQFVDYPWATYHAGIVPETLKPYGMDSIAFANLDMDLYQPMRDALAFILPRMVKGGVIVVDDYNDPDWPGVTKAVNELGKDFEIRITDTQARISL
jgi:hypothetical protein